METGGLNVVAVSSEDKERVYRGSISSYVKDHL